jgi:hypothetical protein
MIDWAPERSRQPHQSQASEKLTCEVERYTVHKHFYGNGKLKFQKSLRKKKTSRFRAVVSVTVWSD